MISNGLVDEVKGLLARGFDPDLPAFSAIGYREIILYLKNEMTMEEAVIEIKKRTRQFVRRQTNWFKANDPEIKWFQVNGETMNQMTIMINERLHP